MAKQTQIDRAIANLEAERAVIDAAIEKLKAQRSQTQTKTRTRKARPAIAEVKSA